MVFILERERECVLASWEGGGCRGRGRRREADSPMSEKPHSELHLSTLRSQPEPKSRVQCLRDWGPQYPFLKKDFFKKDEYTPKTGTSSEREQSALATWKRSEFQETKMTRPVMWDARLTWELAISSPFTSFPGLLPQRRFVEQSQPPQEKMPSEPPTEPLTP